MAKVDIKMPDDFLIKVSKLADQTDVIIPKVLDAGGEVVLEKVKSNLRSVIGRDTKYPSESTGELLSSLGVTPAKQDRDGNFNVKVGFAEPRSDGGSNAKIANIIEYGKHGQPAKPFLKPAKSASKKACIEAMAAKLDEEIKNL
ncbi:phage protein, hk97 gp10 family, putative [Heliomicrobium modesticaldum Ice1]|uniref:Phage protein, hk97 gp10 family, putative n=1 Tax=Heliobacterium modesticaldum (strain ATCC 51547 / Ice1) TaxID=498761 RepID=B0TD22_HELMI|nr:HK97-gp10 family putative phage morphogenesis protein [Heliomicrobium modesticaldum]ABZ85473.1 phage protein, hk97 gp10 family, putative [Heliomicrobium modesticaldum Ice1]